MSVLAGVFSVLLSLGGAQQPITSNMQSFSNAIKGGTIYENVETTVFEYSSDSPGVVTEQWYTGCFDEKTIVRMYIDGETVASIDFKLLLGHGVGFSMASENNNTPWGSRRISHNAASGGLFNTYQVPFSSSVKITITHWRNGTYWYIVRGITNYQIVVGNLQLPNTKNTRLRLYKNENVMLTPLEFLTLANVTGTAGMLYQVFLMANSSDYNYLEACFRARIDGSSNYQWLSSGTEDFFLSAYYFNRGLYHDNDAGCTYFDGVGAMSAYKFFENDPVLFTNGFQLVWRCGETQGDADGCPSSYSVSQGVSRRQDPKNTLSNLKLANTNVTTYVWVYEYDLD